MMITATEIPTNERRTSFTAGVREMNRLVAQGEPAAEVAADWLARSDLAG